MLSDVASKKKNYPRSLLLGIWQHISHIRRIQLGLLLLMMIINATTELISLGAVLPFLSVLSDPEILWQQPIIESVANSFGIDEPSHLLLPTTALFIITVVIAGVIRLINLWLIGRLSASVGSDLSCEAYMRTLYQPYEVHVNRNSSAVINATTTQLNRTVAAISSLLQLITAGLVTAGLLIGLTLINWKVSFSSIFIIGSLYYGYSLIARKKLTKNSHRISTALTQRLKAMQEGLGAIRDVLSDGLQPTFLEIYERADRPQRRLQAQNQFISLFPRYVLEALGIVSLALLGFILVFTQGNGNKVIPLLGAWALGAQRLLPALQQVFFSWASIKSFNADLYCVLEMLEQPIPSRIRKVAPMSLSTSIRLEQVNFTYTSEDEKRTEAIKNLNLEVSVGERIGIVGSSGSGKSTLMDIMMGLLKPSSGKILVDGIDVHDTSCPMNLHCWRAAVAHVPQSIYLFDSSIAENIAFGERIETINMERVQKAAEQAQIASFIESTKEGYKTFVGECGIRMSGGQRQRIGIARALYKRAQVMFLDEATSALDTETEMAVIKSVDNLGKDLTIFVVAHRLSTVENCDRVICLDNGTIIDGG